MGTTTIQAPRPRLGRHVPGIFLLLALLTAPLLAADWPQWRGPARDGRSPETGLLAAWPEGGPPLAWRAAGMGHGYSSVAVVGERLYTLGDVGETQHVLAVSVEDGHTLWKTPIGPGWEDNYIGARSTPAVDGEHLYALSTEGVLLCLETGGGEIRWRRDLPKEHGAGLMMAKGQYSWKFAESPLVDGDRVIVTPGASDALLAAFDKRTGKELWRTRAGDRDLGDFGADGAGYSSAVVSNAGGVRQIVQLLGRGVIGVEASTGRLLWHYGRVANGIANIATPLATGDHVFVSTGYGTGSALLEITRKGDAFEAREVYFLTADTMQNHHGGLILDGGHVYTGTGHNKGFPLAVKMASGEVAWGPIRNQGRDSAAVAFAEGRLYFRYQNGLMVLIEATPEEYREHGSFQIPDVDQFSWSHPVIAGGRLYLREQDNLFAYDIRAGAEKPAAAGR